MILHFDDLFALLALDVKLFQFIFQKGVKFLFLKGLPTNCFMLFLIAFLLDTGRAEGLVAITCDWVLQKVLAQRACKPS